MNAICPNINCKKSLLLFTILTAMLIVSACGKKEDEKTTDSTYRYEHIDKYVRQYSDIIMSTAPEGMEMERLLMDINSRCEMLMAAGDTLGALYFHHAIEDEVRHRDNTLADRIFGTRPYSAFTIDR